MKLVLVLGAATLMSVVGVAALRMVFSFPAFKIFDLVLPSCLTWLLLAPLLKSRAILTTVGIGLLSPVFGAAFVLLLIPPFQAPAVVGPLLPVLGAVFLLLLKHRSTLSAKRVSTLLMLAAAFLLLLDWESLIQTPGLGDSFGYVLYAILIIFLTAPVTLTVGVATALLLRFLLDLQRSSGQAASVGAA